jgi:hypothetical protein
MIEAPEVKIYWVNIYRGIAGSCGSVYESREMADQMAGRNRLACKALIASPGDGLEGDDDDRD